MIRIDAVLGFDDGRVSGPSVTPLMVIQTAPFRVATKRLFQAMFGQLADKSCCGRR